MKLTNRLGLPEPLVNAVANDGYSRGAADISVTSLLSPPRKAALDEAHRDELEEDVSDRIWSLVGQSIHAILERASATGIAERRMSMTIEGWKVSGGMDLVCKNRILSDYKTTTAYKFKNNQVPEDFEQQLNCYAEILRDNGEEVAKLQIVAILRDWSKLEARRDPAYPQSQVLVLPVQMWRREKVQAFMRNRVILHQQARLAVKYGLMHMDRLIATFPTRAEAQAMKDGAPECNEIYIIPLVGDLPDCTPEERWARPNTFALMKQGQKKAVKLYDNEADATAHAGTSPALYVQARPGESIRCAAYCSASKFCSQFNKKPVNQANESEDVPA